MKIRRLRLAAVYVCLSILAIVVFNAILNPTESDQINLAYSYSDTSLFDASYNDHSSIGVSELERFLQFDDDDRHNGGPDDQDVTNGPTVIGYTKMPSSKPSLEPSPPPTLKPSLLPTSSPTSEPSGKHE
jgi:hypothetical protein